MVSQLPRQLSNGTPLSTPWVRAPVSEGTAPGPGEQGQGGVRPDLRPAWPQVGGAEHTLPDGSITESITVGIQASGLGWGEAFQRW